MSLERSQEINKLKVMLKTLRQYSNSEITHTFNSLSLTYCNVAKTFIIKDKSNGKIEYYNDVDTCSLAIYEKLHSEVKEVAE
jgi:hypothetical protein